jgi:hypothetical protein
MFRKSRSSADSKKQPPFRIWREPVIHFFALGLVVFGLYALLDKKPEAAQDPFLVEVTSADIEWMRTMWSKRMGREPTVEEMRGAVNQMIREQVLSREAVSLGLDEGDTVVRRRLAQKMDFLFQDLSNITEPSDSELQAYLRQQRSSYEIPAQMTFTHVYFSTDRRGEEAAAEAIRKLLDQLHTGKGNSSDAISLGDPFLLPSRFADQTHADIQKTFGSRFAETVWRQEPQSWQGPVPSGYGLHAVFVHQRSDAMLPDLSEVREKLKADWLADRQREISRAAYDKVRSRYRVLLEGMPYDLDVSG